MDDMMPVDIPEEDRRFSVETLAQASWALRKLRDDVALEEEYRTVYRQEKDRLLAELERLNGWWQGVEARHLARRLYFERLLEGFHRRRLEGNPREKTIELPEGRLQLRQTPMAVEVTDADAALAAMEAQDLSGLYTVTRSVNRSALKRYVQQTGDLLPGVEVKAAETRFRVSLVGAQDEQLAEDAA
jgi:hypothetical protein